MTNDSTTVTIAKSLSSAFDYFNKELFDNQLPECLITLNRKTGTYGYFSHDRFVERGKDTLPALGETKDEIALNPDSFGRSDKEILSTLVHEMVHHWQQHFGKPGKTNGYHNGEWASKMQWVGLLPLSETTGYRGTGFHVSHEIKTNGAFDTTCDKFLKDNKKFDVSFTSISNKKVSKKTYKKYSYRYECPTCDTWVKAPSDTQVVCAKCLEVLVNVDEDEN